MRETSPKSRYEIPAPAVPAGASISTAKKKSASAEGGNVGASAAEGGAILSDSSGNDISDSGGNVLGG